MRIGPWIAAGVVAALGLPAASQPEPEAGSAKEEAAAAPSAQDARSHQVLPGETLWQIAELTVGEGALWPALYLANRDRIKDPALVYPGQELLIPDIDPDERAALRRAGASGRITP